MQVSDNFIRDSSGVLRGSTGVPVDDGSPAFEELVRSRIVKSYDKKNLISIDELMENMRRRAYERAR
jgi:hypothetical protein